ncbi:hypothetical protein C8R43DRAFT_1143355 [Mycena crocata]|nr:hypothetical protein C8R43DRAFT_1143355 [Mycena crocata]
MVDEWVDVSEEEDSDVEEEPITGAALRPVVSTYVDLVAADSSDDDLYTLLGK